MEPKVIYTNSKTPKIVWQYKPPVGTKVEYKIYLNSTDSGPYQTMSPIKEFKAVFQNTTTGIVEFQVSAVLTASGGAVTHGPKSEMVIIKLVEDTPFNVKVA
jgi:hypothetical protein